jgi:hypothetical protein
MNKNNITATTSKGGNGGSGPNKIRLGEEVLRHLKTQHPIDIKNLEIEDQPSRQRKRHIKRQLMKKFKNRNK